MNKSAYKDAGVDIDAGAELVERIKPHVKSTFRSGVMSGIGGFGAFFDPAAAGYSDPILISSTDGVGTKLKVAIDTGIHDTVGIDLVAMCVNDIIVQGAEPLFFLDYFACGSLEVDVAERVIAGIAKGCEIAGCALIGGETAEMPGMYGNDDYDLAGFTVGAAERERIITGDKAEEGDVVLALASSGLHSNGYSLVRKIIKDSGFSYGDKSPFDEGKTIGQSIMTPTRIYVCSVLKALHSCDVHAIANITGGGLTENIPRVIPEGLCVRLDAKKWELPPLMKWLAGNGKLSAEDLACTLNCGIGMVLICSEAEAEECADILEREGENVKIIGQVEKSGDSEAVVIEHMEEEWIKS